LAADSVVAASLGITACIILIMKFLSSYRATGYALTNEKSWLLKKIFSAVYGIAFVMGFLIYSGLLDLAYKPIV